MAWKGYSSYGRSALGVQISVTGLDELLAKIEAAGNGIDEACKKAVNAALPIIEKDMKVGAEQHRKTGAVVDAIEITPAKQEGNFIYGTVGIDKKKHPEAIHAVFQEYGDGHSPGFPDPFIRPALDNNKAEIKRTMKQELRAAGIPVEDSNTHVDPGKAGG